MLKKGQIKIIVYMCLVSEGVMDIINHILMCCNNVYICLVSEGVMDIINHILMSIIFKPIQST